MRDVCIICVLTLHTKLVPKNMYCMHLEGLCTIRHLVICRAGLGPNALAWAWLGRAWAHENLEPSPG